MKLVASVRLVVCHAHLRDSDPKLVKALLGLYTATLGHRRASHEPSHDFGEVEPRLGGASVTFVAQILQHLLLTQMVFFEVIWVRSGNIQSSRPDGPDGRVFALEGAIDGQQEDGRANRYVVFVPAAVDQRVDRTLRVLSQLLKLVYGLRLQAKVNFEPGNSFSSNKQVFVVLKDDLAD